MEYVLRYYGDKDPIEDIYIPEWEHLIKIK